jgi:hypothetical protein
MKPLNSYLASLLAPSAFLCANLAYAEPVDSMLQREMPGAHLATSSDFSPALEGKYRGQVLHEADFNGDGLSDWAVVIVVPRSRTYGVYYIISDKPQPTILNLLSREYEPKEQSGFIKTPMFFKPVGELGIAARDYTSLTKDLYPDDSSPEAGKRLAEERERKVAPYRAVPAIEVWTGMSSSQKDETLEELSYCSHTWYFERNELKNFNACD